MMPLVTIGVPYFNAEKFVVQTLQSIKNQTYPYIQLVLVDDCSTDSTKQIVEKWLTENASRFTEVISLHNIENKGTAYSCRRIQDSTKGTLFSKLDADDIIFPEKTSNQVKLLLENVEVALVYGNTQLIDSESILIESDYFTVQEFSTVINNMGPSGYVFSELLKEDFIPNSSVMLKTEVLERAGGYDESLFTEDWDLWLRIARQYPILFMEGYISQYRLHDQSVMRKKSSLVKNYLSCIKAVLKHEGINSEYDYIIAQHLNRYIVGMYRYGYIDKKLLKKNLLMNTNLKTTIYYLLGVLNIKINQKK